MKKLLQISQNSKENIHKLKFYCRIIVFQWSPFMKSQSVKNGLFLVWNISEKSLKYCSALILTKNGCTHFEKIKDSFKLGFKPVENYSESTVCKREVLIIMALKFRQNIILNKLISKFLMISIIPKFFL